MATAEELGEVGGYYFSRKVDWLRRHVQHLSFPDPQSARQQLTIDIVLPNEEARIDRYRRATEGMVFCLPVARLEKGWVIHELDFVDEGERVLPLLTRDVDASITAVALKKALIDAGMSSADLTMRLPVPAPGGGIKTEEQDIIDRLVRMDAIPATSYREIAYGLIAPLPGSSRDRFHHLAADLTENSYVWLALVGEPGEQRTVKLSYGIDLPARARVIRKPGTPTVRAYDGVLPVSVVIPGNVDVGKSAADILEEVAAAFGLTTRTFRIPTLTVAHVDSYHLAFTAPEGVIVHEMTAELTTETGASVSPPVSARGRHGTLYHHGPVLAHGEAAAALRPDPRGLRIATLYAAATAALVWIVRASSPLPSGEDDAVAALLLVIPTFLAVFARRRSEHELVGSLLSGIRLLIFLVAASAVGAGAAVAGLHMWLSTRHMATVAAIVATTAAAVVAVAWLRWAATAAERWWKAARLREHRPG